MGLDFHSAQFLRHQKRRRVRFDRVLTLGRQGVYMPADVYRSQLQALGATPKETGFADDFFRGLGATSLDFMDVSNYEGANVVHDMNQPIPGSLAENYDCVFDGGSLEHIFNFPTALKNCMELVKPGGHLIIIAPWNNYAGHGFYQLSPELFYSALSAENGYSVEQMAIVQRDRWYAVASPAVVRGRIELLNNDPTLLFLAARRVSRGTIFSNWPQQSDYSVRWATGHAARTDPPVSAGLKEALLKKSAMLRSLQRRWQDRKRRKQHSVSNPKNFQPLEMGD